VRIFLMVNASYRTDSIHVRAASREIYLYLFVLGLRTSKL
jgi:hypothetical protein